jgi:hypothetical protein
VAVVAIAGALVGCAAARLEAGAYVVRDKGYRVAPPAGWERIPSEADLAFRQRALGAGLMAEGTCDATAPTRSLAVLARHLRFGLRDVEGLAETPVTVAGRPGVRSRFAARLDGIPVAVRAITVDGRGCVYDLVVVAPPDSIEAATPDFERFAASFRFLEAGP